MTTSLRLYAANGLCFIEPSETPVPKPWARIMQPTTAAGPRRLVELGRLATTKHTGAILDHAAALALPVGTLVAVSAWNYLLVEDRGLRMIGSPHYFEPESYIRYTVLGMHTPR